MGHLTFVGGEDYLLFIYLFLWGFLSHPPPHLHNRMGQNYLFIYLFWGNFFLVNTDESKQSMKEMIKEKRM
jgi:hypothetical protein